MPNRSPSSIILEPPAPKKVVSLDDFDPRWLNTLAIEGYTDLTVIEGKLCGLQPFVFTTGLMVGIEPMGYNHRYCFEFEHDARNALAAWTGDGHPGGPWIKMKGIGVDLLNPALGADTQDSQPPGEASCCRPSA